MTIKLKQTTWVPIFMAAAITACSALVPLAKAKSTPSAPSSLPYVTDGTLKEHYWKLFTRFSDQFNGKTINHQKWIAVTSNGWGKNWNQEEKNITQADGKLDVAVKYEPHKLPNGVKKEYTTGMLRSRSPILYGYFEAKIKGPLPQPGTNGAFWLGGESLHWMRQPSHPHDAVLAHTPANTRDPFTWNEIDIVEAARRPSHPDLYRVSHNVHVFKDPNIIKKARDWSVNVGGGYTTWNPSSAYHIYGCLWTPQIIKMYVDGKLVGSIKNKWWHTPHYLLFSNHLRAPYSIPGKGTTKGFPSVMKVDYVRVWKSPQQIQPPLLPKEKITSRSQWVKELDLQTFNQK